VDNGEKLIGEALSLNIAETASVPRETLMEVCGKEVLAVLAVMVSVHRLALPGFK
jgi:hypothetical protein